MELSVIIVNYNGLKYLKGCFDSLYENLKGITFEIIVVDNNSADESCNYIRKYYPGIRLIESPKNLGFGKGNNVGAKEAMGKYLLLINILYNIVWLIFIKQCPQTTHKKYSS